MTLVYIYITLLYRNGTYGTNTASKTCTSCWKHGGTNKGNSVIINDLLYCNARVSANERRTSTLLFLFHSIKATTRNTQLSTLGFSHSHPNPFKLWGFHLIALSKLQLWYYISICIHILLQGLPLIYSDESESYFVMTEEGLERENVNQCLWTP